MLSNRPQEALSSNTQTNPKKQVKSITLRSGKQLEQKQVLSESIHQKDSSEEAKETHIKIARAEKKRWLDSHLDSQPVVPLMIQNLCLMLHRSPQ